MTEDTEYLMEKLGDQPITNQIVISYDGKMNKLRRDNYYPDENGHIKFLKQTDWTGTGFSVSEMLELLKKYQSLIVDVGFETWDGSEQPMVAIYESELYSSWGEYTCVIITGDSGVAFSMPGKVLDDKIGWATDLLYPDKFRR